PPKKQNNITIRINEGHDVLFQANAKDHEMGNDVTIEVNGSFTKNGWNTFKVGNNVHFIVDGTMVFNWNEFEAKNNTIFDIKGVFTNKTNSVFKNNTIFNISEEGSFKNTSVIETGDNLKFNVSEGSGVENKGHLKTNNMSTFNIHGNALFSCGNGLDAGNDMEINIFETGSVLIDQTFKTEDNLVMNVEGSFENTADAGFTAGDDASVQVGDNGVFLTSKSMTFGDALQMQLEGSFENTADAGFTAGDDASVQVGDNAVFMTSKSMTFGDALQMQLEGSFENTADAGFIAGANTFLQVTENASYTTTTSSSFGDEFLMIVDGEATIGGNNFSFGQGSEIQVLGSLDVTNHWVFNSGNSDNVFYACEGSVNNPDYINDVIYLDCDVLPVELLYFEARTDASNDILLTWATASETNSDYFTIERSTDAQNWTALETVQSAGNSNYLIEYSYTDTDTQSGIYYYRLVQTDFDGAFEIFESVAVEKESLTTFEIYNVYRSQQQVVIQGIFQANNRVMVTDLMGNVYFQGALSTDQRQISFRIDSKVSAIVVKSTDGSTRGSAYSKKFSL
ncbi:MAG: hypothetical protein ACLFQS_03860, partial [Bacteroidales bacterium]